ncbi:MAG: BatA domain-containing protein [Gemmatimonadaceae bacterium]
MSFLAPWMLLAGAAAALGVVALHLLTTRRPPPAMLPTARFVPESDVRAVARASRPTDLVVLTLRALAVLLIGAAFAQPVPDAPGPRVRTVFALDRSRSVADTAAARAIVAARFAEGDTLVEFGSGARVGELSPMFVSARRAAGRIARGADSVRLVIVSPVGDGAVDAATPALRAAWPGRNELERPRGVADTTAAPRPGLVTTLEDDALAPAIARLPSRRGAHAVRIVRGDARPADSAWARGAGHVLLRWPVAAGGVAGPEGVTAFGLHRATIVAPLERLPIPPGERVVARWADGQAAATERALGGGCVRDVGVGVPLAGDLTLRAPFERFLAALVEPCGGARGVAIADSALTWLTAPGPLAAGATLAAADADRTPSFWLLVVASALLIGESVVRRRPPAEVAE